MKVVFFSESQMVGKIPRTFDNARNDVAWSCMMDADWCNARRTTLVFSRLFS